MAAIEGAWGGAHAAALTFRRKLRPKTGFGSAASSFFGLFRAVATSRVEGNGEDFVKVEYYHGFSNIYSLGRLVTNRPSVRAAKRFRNNGREFKAREMEIRIESKH